MPSNKRQKELARRRAERQAARRAAERARRRKRRVVALLSGVGAVAAVVLLVVLVRSLGDDDKAVDDPAAGPKVCETTAPPPPKKQTFKKAEQVIDVKKSYRAVIETSCGGAIGFELFDDKAPKTANSLAFLASKNFYDGTFCHRMTASPGLTVLQCGDPEGTGGGGPGYTLAEENLKGATYKRGTVAMAKTNAPHSTGSQFFLVSKDSELPPQYTVIGQMDDASLAVLDKIMAVGIEGDATDGPPKEKIYIKSFRVTAS